MNFERERIKKNDVLARKILRRKKLPTDSQLVEIWFSLLCRCKNPIPMLTGKGCQKCGGHFFSKVKEQTCFCPYRTKDYKTFCENKRYPQRCKVKTCRGNMLSKLHVAHFLGVVDTFYKTYKNEHDEK